MTACLWCKATFDPRRGGSPQRFCCPKHRTMFWAGARHWAERAVGCGVLTVADLQSGAMAPCTALASASSAAPVVDDAIKADTRH